MSALADSEAEAMTDMLMCLTESRDGGKKTDGGGGEVKEVKKKMLMLFNSFPHRHWQQDLRQHADRCVVMKPGLGETRLCLFLAH